MSKIPNKAIKTKPPEDSSGEKQEIGSKLDSLEARLDIGINVLLEILFSNSQYQKAIPYTDKVAYLAQQGLEAGDISKMVGRPSNWVSNRLKESKSRNKPKRQRSPKEAPKPQWKGANRGKA